MSKKQIFFRRSAVAALSASLLITGLCCHTALAGKKPAISCKKLTMKIGEKKKLRIKNTKKKVRWNSSNSKIASVNKTGLVRAKKEGSVKITALLNKQKFTCKITVLARESESPAASQQPASTVQPTAGQPTQPASTVLPTTEPPIQTVLPQPTSESPQPTQTPAATIRPFVSPDAHWEEGKKSGTEEDYKNYFSHNMKLYTKKQKETTAGTMQNITYHSDVVGADREASVYLPPNYSEDQKYPVLYLLHGIGCDKGQWPSINAENILSNMICRGETKPLIAVFPSVIPKDGLSEGNGVSPENIAAFTLFEEEFLRDLEPYINSHYSVSENRTDIGVCGLSMGGMEALHLGFSIKDHFNYIGSFSAAPTLNQELLTLEGCLSAPEFVLLCSGTADKTVGENPYNYHMTLEKNGVDHVWYQFPNGGHSDNVWQNGLVNFLRGSFQPGVPQSDAAQQN